MDDIGGSPLLADAKRRRELASRLLAWFQASARNLPWRKTNDLYRIWISESMLQQTQVATVIGFYERFLSAFPDVNSLASASEEQVLRLWEGLGYYRRARQLHAAARKIASQFGGTFPTSFDDVRSLPGIGRYTAGAILSIGLDQRLPILEANTVRVLSRLTAFRGDTASTAGQRFLWSIAEQILPRKQAGTFNQALMELGSEICTPRTPACDRCPVAKLCPTFALRLQNIVPAARKRTQYEEVTEAAIVISRGSKVLVRQCGPGERWAGLWDFPRFAVQSSNDAGSSDELRSKTAALTGVTAEPHELLTTIKHGVTRFRITLLCYRAAYQSSAKRDEAKPSTAIKWVGPQELLALPLSTTGRKISRLLATG